LKDHIVLCLIGTWTWIIGVCHWRDGLSSASLPWKFRNRLYIVVHSSLRDIELPSLNAQLHRDLCLIHLLISAYSTQDVEASAWGCGVNTLL
jgi:hypothetical protein